MFTGLFRKIFFAVVILVSAYAVTLYLLASGPVKQEVWEARRKAMGDLLAAVGEAAAVDRDRLDRALARMAPGRTGRVFLFSADGRVRAPASAREAVEPVLRAVNPETGNPLVEDLIRAASSRGEAFLFTAPAGPEAGSRRAAWVRRLDVDGLRAAAWMDAGAVTDNLRTLGWTIGLLSAVLATLVLYVAWLAIGRFTAPIRRLSQVAREVERGDLDAFCDVGGDDEVGRLSCTFNSMVARLRENIRELDGKVRERTAELGTKNQSLLEENEKRRAAEAELASANDRLRRWVDELSDNHARMARLNRLSDMLQAASTEKDAVDLTAGALRDLFAGGSGALYMAGPSDTRYRAVAWWGLGEKPPDFGEEECGCLARGGIHLSRPNEPNDPVCLHARPGPDEASLCVPLAAQGQVLGVLHVTFSLAMERFSPGQAARRLEGMPRLAAAVADHAALALSNIRLREKLKELSVRDPLTGLFNRRYMEETLDREADQAIREGRTVGLIMLDVDLFKAFNDTHGHEAGDFLLRKLGLMLAKSVRGGDVACRYGGEEFLLILPGASLADTRARAEEIRSAVEKDLHLRIKDAHHGATVSAGAAVFPDHGADPRKVIAAADAALYRAKAEGRNRVASA